MKTETLHMDSDSVAMLETDELTVVRQGGRVEVWDGDGRTHYGNLPENVSVADVRLCMLFYERGHVDGLYAGREEAKRQIRTALGL